MSAHEWSAAIERMLVRIEDTAGRVKDGFPHWADPETGQWTTSLFESLLGLAGRIDPLRL